MPYPRFVAEMAEPSHRAQLRAGVVSGYATIGGFLALAALAHIAGVVPFQRGFAAPIAFKLVANTLLWLALEKDRFVLEVAGLNVLADMLSMTAVIYFTGGELSPLFPIYAIEITVLALLGNVGVTIVGAVMALACFAGMAILVHAGVLASHPPPVALAGGLSGLYTGVDILYAAFVIGVPTFYTAKILQDLRQKSRALEARTEALVEAGRQRSQFMANVTHELRTPIHGICGLSDLVESGVYGEVSPKQREAHRSIKGSARSLLALIDDLLELSVADAGKLELRPEDIDLHELLSTVVASARWMLGTKALTVDMVIAEDIPPVFADPRKVKQVALNLLANAVKFTPEGGKVVVRAAPKGGRVEITVADTGIGIAQEDQARIFEDFYQVDGSPERTYGGVGLGLSLVKRLTEAMGGTVRVESAAGRGATFTVTLPADREC